MLHTTIGFPVTEEMRYLELSSKRNGFNFVMINKCSNGVHGTVFDKITILMDFISNISIDKSEILLFTDAYDTLILENEEAILSKFYDFKCDILFNAESNFWPPVENNEHRKRTKDIFDNESTSKWRYLNSGAYIGYIWAIEMMLDFCINEFKISQISDDQLLFQEFYMKQKLSNSLKLLVDTDCRIFCTFFDSRNDYFLDKFRVINSTNHNIASVIHSNGDKKLLKFLKFYKEIFYEDNYNREIDLRFLSNGQGYLSLSQNNILYFSNEINEKTLIFIVKGNKFGLLITSSGSILTFAPNFSINLDARLPKTWEVINVRDNFMIDGHRKLSEYIDNNEKINLFLLPIPVHYFCDDPQNSLPNAIKTIQKTLIGPSYYF
jgi:hypothetical protein